MLNEVNQNLNPLIRKYMIIRRVRREHLWAITNTGPIDDAKDFQVFNDFLEAGIVARQCIYALMALREFKRENGK